MIVSWPARLVATTSCSTSYVDCACSIARSALTPSRVEAIVELSDDHEADPRRRHQAAPDAVWHDVAELGPLYRLGESFPFWPAWLGQVR